MRISLSGGGGGNTLLILTFSTSAKSLISILNHIQKKKKVLYRIHIKNTTEVKFVSHGASNDYVFELPVGLSC